MNIDILDSAYTVWERTPTNDITAFKLVHLKYRAVSLTCELKKEFNVR